MKGASVRVLSQETPGLRESLAHLGGGTGQVPSAPLELLFGRVPQHELPIGLR